MSRVENDCVVAKLLCQGLTLRPAVSWLPPQRAFRFSLVGEGTATQTVRCSEPLNFSLLTQGHGSFRPIWGYFYDSAPSGFVSATHIMPEARCQNASTFM